MEEIHSTLDCYEAAFLRLKGFTPKLAYRNGKIVFIFQRSIELARALKKYNGGERLCALDFVREVKELKGQIFSLKDKEKGGMRSYGNQGKRLD